MDGHILQHQWLRFGILAALSTVVVGCKTIEGGPDRLFSVSEEVTAARSTVIYLSGLYYADPPPSDVELIRLRNEIISRRMYIIDVEYSEYEAALTSERQKFGFATAVASNTLGLAGGLTTPVRSAQLLSGIGTAVGATRGFYDSEIVIAKTIEIAQGQMRALRDTKAKTIQAKTTLPIATYPLSSAMHDLEDLYRAGTLTAGLVKALGEAGTAAQVAAISKDSIYVGTYARDNTSDLLQSYISRGGKANTARIRLLNGLLLELGYKVDVRTIIDAAESAPIRKQLVDYAAARGIDLTK